MNTRKPPGTPGQHGPADKPVYDPRERRLNPQIEEFVGILNDHWDSLLSEKDYLDRKSRLRIIRQIIDQIIDQPEWLEADLQTGAASRVNCWIDPEVLAPVECLNERPFDRPDASSGRHFFYSDGGLVSSLFVGQSIHPQEVPGLLSLGAYVYCLEQRHLTLGETGMRVISENLWRQMFPDYYQQTPGRTAAQRFFLLCDPRGVGGGERVLRIAVLDDEAKCIELAEELAESLQIRFLVARENHRYCTR
jgi:hypothetical protein